MPSEKPGCLSAILRLFGLEPKEFTPPPHEYLTKTNLSEEEEKLPYLLRDDFFSNAELSFYHVLNQSISGQWIICPKISLAEIFFISQPHKNQAHRNRIDRKHVDFLLCDPDTLKPILGIELDDTSHTRPDRVERDVFVEEVFETAGLPLLRVPVQRAYIMEELRHLIQKVLQGNSIDQPIGVSFVNKALSGLGQPAPICPKCGIPMIMRTAQRGSNAGTQFYGCPNYPRCKEIISISRTTAV